MNDYLMAFIILVLIIGVVSYFWIQLIVYLKSKYAWIDRFEIFLVLTPPIVFGLILSLTFPTHFIP